MLRTEKQRHLKSKLERCEEEKDVGGIWKNIKGYLGWGSAGGAPTELTDPDTGQLTNSPQRMANIQNKYYKNKVSQIRGKLPQRGDPTAVLRGFMNKRPHPRSEDLKLKSVSPLLVDKIIKELGDKVKSS